MEEPIVLPVVEPVIEAVVPVVPALPTRDEIIKSSGDQMRQWMRTPEIREHIEKVMNTSIEEETIVAKAEADRLVAEAAAKAEAETAAAKAVADAQVEADRLAAEEAAKAAEAAKPKKIVVEYQATDEDGKPIGQKTHIEGYTWEEVSEKQRVAHVNAVRYAERMKKLKQTFKKEEPKIANFLNKSDLLEINTDLNSGDAAKIEEANRRLGDDPITRERMEYAVTVENSRRDSESREFVRRHASDFNPCQANAVILSQYIQDNGLEWTADSLEIAFYAVEPQLAPKVVVAPPAPVIVPPVEENTPAPVTPAAPAPPPAAAAPVVAPAAVPNTPAPAKKIPDGGLIPGQSVSGGRPVVKVVGLTKLDIKNMPRDEYRAKMRNPAFVKQVNELFAKK